MRCCGALLASGISSPDDLRPKWNHIIESVQRKRELAPALPVTLRPLRWRRDAWSVLAVTAEQTGGAGHLGRRCSRGGKADVQPAKGGPADSVLMCRQASPSVAMASATWRTWVVTDSITSSKPTPSGTVMKRSGASFGSQ